MDENVSRKKCCRELVCLQITLYCNFPSFCTSGFSPSSGSSAFSVSSSMSGCTCKRKYSNGARRRSLLYLFFVSRTKKLYRFQIDALHALLGILCPSFSETSSYAAEAYSQYHSRHHWNKGQYIKLLSTLLPTIIYKNIRQETDILVFYF